MKRLIGCTVVLCLLALTVGCGGATGTGTLAYVSNSTGTGFTVFTVNTNGTLTTSSISPLSTPASPKVIQFSNNGKWAYFLDAAGANIYGYVRAGNGTFSEPIKNCTPCSLFTLGASSLVINPNSGFLYVAEPNAGNGSLVTCPIDQSTGEPSCGNPLPYGATNISQLVITPSGGALYGLLPAGAGPAKGVMGWSLSTGIVTYVTTTSAGNSPIYMVLSANGSFMYVLESTDTTLYTTVVTGVTGQSPNILGYNVGTGGNVGTLQPMPGAGGNPVFNIFNENADRIFGVFPMNPIGGATSYDSRFLFVLNQGTSNISVFKITAADPTISLGGGLNEIGGSVTNGVSTASPFPCGAAGGCAAPLFLAVAKANNALFVLNQGLHIADPGSIFQFAIDENTGQLRPLNPASVTTGNGPTWITIR